MGIKLQEDGTYSVSVAKRHPITRKSIDLKRIKIKTKAEASRVRDELIIQLNDKIKHQVTPIFKTVVEKYIESCRLSGLQESTIYTAKTCLEAHAVSEWSNRLIDSITTQDIRLLIQTKLSDKALGHQKYVIKYIRAAFNFALDCGYIQRNPTPQIKFKSPDKIHSVLTEEQVKILLHQAQLQDWEWYSHVAMAVYTGMRSGELFALTWDKVDLDQKIIKVDMAYNKRDKFKSTKSGDDRLVEIAPPLMPLLQELKLKYGSTSPYVLPRNAKWERGEQAEELRFFLKFLGLPELRFHDLRATWATLLLGRNVPPAVVMKMGGWKNMETMMIYMRKAGLDIRGSTECLSNLHMHGLREAKLLNFKS